MNSFRTTFLLVLCICFNTPNVFSQEYVGLFYNSRWQLVDPESAYSFYRKCYLTEEGNFDGEITDFDNSGKKLMTGYYKNHRKEGEFIYFFPDGAVKAVGKYIDNDISGEWKYYNNDGSLFIKALYEGPFKVMLFKPDGDTLDPIILYENKTTFAKEVNKLTNIDRRHRNTENFVRAENISEAHYPMLSKQFMKDAGREEPSKEKETPSNEKFVIVDQMAEYPGGISAFYSLIGSHLKYPQEATKAKIEGRVFVEFIINRDGFVEDVKTIKGIGAGCDEEAERVVSLSPPWKPARQKGEAVRIKMVLPITFKL